MKTKPECRFCKTNTDKRQVVKRRKLQLFEETDKLIDLICTNEILVSHRIGYEKDHKKYGKNTIRRQNFRETCDNHIVLLKEKVI